MYRGCVLAVTVQGSTSPFLSSCFLSSLQAVLSNKAIKRIKKTHKMNIENVSRVTTSSGQVRSGVFFAVMVACTVAPPPLWHQLIYLSFSVHTFSLLCQKHF